MRYMFKKSKRITKTVVVLICVVYSKLMLCFEKKSEDFFLFF